MSLSGHRRRRPTHQNRKNRCRARRDRVGQSCALDAVPYQQHLGGLAHVGAGLGFSLVLREYPLAAHARSRDARSASKAKPRRDGASVFGTTSMRRACWAGARTAAAVTLTEVPVDRQTSPSMAVHLRPSTPPRKHRRNSARAPFSWARLCEPRQSEGAPVLRRRHQA